MIQQDMVVSIYNLISPHQLFNRLVDIGPITIHATQEYFYFSFNPIRWLCVYQIAN